MRDYPEGVAVQCIAEFMKVALGPDPVRHGLDLADVAAAWRFRRLMDEVVQTPIIQEDDT